MNEWALARDTKWEQYDRFLEYIRAIHPDCTKEVQDGMRSNLITLQFLAREQEDYLKALADYKTVLDKFTLYLEKAYPILPRKRGFAAIGAAIAGLFVHKPEQPWKSDPSIKQLQDALQAAFRKTHEHADRIKRLRTALELQDTVSKVYSRFKGVDKNIEAYSQVAQWSASDAEFIFFTSPTNTVKLPVIGPLQV